MRIDAIRAIAIRCQRRIAEVLERFANREPNPSARVDAASDFYTAMLRFAAVVTVAPGNVRSCDQCQEVIERHALQADQAPEPRHRTLPGMRATDAARRRGRGKSDASGVGFAALPPMPGARHDDCIAKPNPQIQNQTAGFELARPESRASPWPGFGNTGWPAPTLQRVDLSGAYLRAAPTLTRADLGGRSPALRQSQRRRF